MLDEILVMIGLFFIIGYIVLREMVLWNTTKLLKEFDFNKSIENLKEHYDYEFRWIKTQIQELNIQIEELKTNLKIKEIK